MQAQMLTSPSTEETGIGPLSFIGIIGEPGAGKTTPAKILLERNIPTEEMRDRIDRAQLGRQAQQQISLGKMVDDAPVINLFRADLADFSMMYPVAGVLGRVGYPRSYGQAEDLDRLEQAGVIRTPIIIAVLLDDEELARERMSGRRNCSKCGKLYHLTFDPSSHPSNPLRCGVRKQDLLCDGILLERQDSTPDAIEERIRTFNTITLPAIRYCRERGWLHPIDGKLPIKNIAAEARRILAVNL